MRNLRLCLAVLLVGGKLALKTSLIDSKAGFLLRLFGPRPVLGGQLQSLACGIWQLTSGRPRGVKTAAYPMGLPEQLSSEPRPAVLSQAVPHGLPSRVLELSREDLVCPSVCTLCLREIAPKQEWPPWTRSFRIPSNEGKCFSFSLMD